MLLIGHAFYYNATVDDAFITFRYSNNLLAGEGPVWNPGERVEGYTSFTWMVLMAIGGLVREHQALISNVFGVAAGVAGLILAWQLARKLADSDRLALLAPLLLALDRTYAGWCTGGLETSLFTTLVLFGWWRWLEELEGERRPIAGLVFGLAAITRPEGAVFFSLAMGWSLLRLLQRRASRRAFAWQVAAFLAISGGHLAFRIAYYGELLPNTFHAKVNGMYLESGVPYMLLFLRHHAVIPLVFVIGIVGWILAVRRPASVNAGAFALAAIAFQTCYVVYIGGDAYEFRFMHTLMPLVAVGTVVLLGALAWRWRWAATVLVVVSTGLTTPRSIVETVSKDYFQTTIPATFEVERLEIGYVRDTEVRIGRWLREIARPDDLLAIDAAGVVPYFSQMPTIDLLGLNDWHVAREELTERGYVGHERFASTEYLLRRKPSIFVSTLESAVGLDECAEMEEELEIWNLEPICVRIPGGPYFSFGTFRPHAAFVDDLRARGVEVVEQP